MIKDIKQTINSLTLKEKAKLLCGYENMATYPLIEKGIPSLILSDGPHGVRKEKRGGNSLSGIANTLPATCFPTGVLLSSTWNKEILKEVGQALSEECKYYDVNVLLGPAINIKRNPLCGRNFEYYSEDPYLTGVLASNIVLGLQDSGVGVCIKHFACNNNEKYRFTGDSILDQRTLREIYLKPFEMVVKNASPYSIMTGYNKVNGVHCSENGYLLNDILRKEWGFDGLAMTDWGGLVNRDIALKNGQDLEMPGQVNHNIQLIIDACNNKSLKEDTIDKSIERLFTLINRTEIADKGNCDFEKHLLLATRVAENGAILLKNNDNILPLSKDDNYLVIGGFFDKMRYQGSGSSLLHSRKILDHKNEFDLRHIKYNYVKGYNETELEIDTKLENEALEKAKEAETIIFYGGQTDYVESEGFDRDNMLLPNNQISLIEKLSKLNKKMILVLFGGSPIEMPFVKHFDAVLNMLLPGDGIGKATTRLLFGEVSPSGRLTETWLISYRDVPYGEKFVSSPLELYKESIYVGYRYYNTFNKTVLFPFGYGLSYSKFEYSNFNVLEEENGVKVSVKVKNVGKFDAYEVVQIYVESPRIDIPRAKRELKAFDKIYLKQNEEKEVTLFINYDELKVYSIKDHQYHLEEGNYTICLNENVNTCIENKTLFLKGDSLKDVYSLRLKELYLNPSYIDNIKDKDFEELIGYKIPSYIKGKIPYTMETPISEFETFFGKMFKNVAKNIGKNQYKKALKIKDYQEREREKKTGLFIYRQMTSNCLRSLSFSSSGMLKYNVALGLLELTNGHLFKGIKCLLQKDKLKK